jgi:hypothetical protein
MSDPRRRHFDELTDYVDTELIGRALFGATE